MYGLVKKSIHYNDDWCEFLLNGALMGHSEIKKLKFEYIFTAYKAQEYERFYRFSF